MGRARGWGARGAGRGTRTADAVFLDRDGTILDELGYVTPDSALHLYPYSLDAIRVLSTSGFAVVVITNQGGVGLGLYDEAFVDRTHAALDARIAAAGGRVAGWYYCPHHPEAVIPSFKCVCECRKPATGLVSRAAQELGIDFARSWVVGDQWRDIEVAHRTGARSILVRTGYGARLEHAWPADIARPTLVADNLIAAAAQIVGLSGGGSVAANVAAGL
jgi:D-glycero-D-manno-heptose 1,7-bisphosphate phosphatase